MRIMMVAALVAGVAGLTAGRATAQTGGIAVGYVSIPGKIGDWDSDRGPMLRAGFDLVSGRAARVGLEASVGLLDRSRRHTADQCILQDGMPGDCFFSLKTRDVPLSLGMIARFGPRTGATSPYLLAGAGFMSTRTYTRQRVTTGDGTELENFRIDASTNDGSLVGHLGAGLSIRRVRSWAFELEGRISPVLHNYSGGFMIEWSPSLTIGIGFDR